MRTWIIALAALMALPAVGAAAVIVAPPVPEQLVEGHTVFTVIEMRKQIDEQQEEFHAAVAVLVREVEQVKIAERFPGVLWFNDQYLVNPTAANAADINIRFPCTGAVLAVDATAADPKPLATTINALPKAQGGHYVESYHITDPNDVQWDVDKWDVSADPLVTSFVWSVALRNAQAGYSVPDDGESNCSPFEDIAGTANKARVKDPGSHGLGHPCGDGTVNCPNLQYNALLYFRISDLTNAGAAKDHSVDPATSTDVSGCHETYGNYESDGALRAWDCPATDDNAEGNSHPYNPELPWPVLRYDGRYNHGGSGGDCDGDGVVDQPTDANGNPVRSDYTGDYECHATRNIAIHYHFWTAPAVRDYYLFDLEGSSAPYHCHDDQDICNFSDVLAAAPSA